MERSFAVDNAQFFTAPTTESEAILDGESISSTQTADSKQETIEITLENIQSILPEDIYRELSRRNFNFSPDLLHQLNQDLVYWQKINNFFKKREKVWNFSGDISDLLNLITQNLVGSLSESDSYDSYKLAEYASYDDLYQELFDLSALDSDLFAAMLFCARDCLESGFSAEAIARRYTAIFNFITQHPDIFDHVFMGNDSEAKSYRYAQLIYKRIARVDIRSQPTTTDLYLNSFDNYNLDTFAAVPYPLLKEISRKSSRLETNLETILQTKQILQITTELGNINQLFDSLSQNLQQQIVDNYQNKEALTKILQENRLEERIKILDRLNNSSVSIFRRYKNQICELLMETDNPELELQKLEEQLRDRTKPDVTTTFDFFRTIYFSCHSETKERYFDTLYRKKSEATHLSPSLNPDNGSFVDRMHLFSRDLVNIHLRCANPSLRDELLSGNDQCIKETNLSATEALTVMDQQLSSAQQRNIELSQSGTVNFNYGDLLKGLWRTQYFYDFLNNGFVCPELLGPHSKNDLSPYDMDTGVIQEHDLSPQQLSSFQTVLESSVARNYVRDGVYLIFKDRGQFVMTRDKEKDEKGNFIAGPEKELPINNGQYEIAYQGAPGDIHAQKDFGVRVGLPITELSAIVASEELQNNQNIGRLNYLKTLLALKGLYVPITNEQGRVIFTIDDFNQLKLDLNKLNETLSSPGKPVSVNEFIQILSTQPYLATAFASDVGVSQGYNLQEHTLMTDYIDQHSQDKSEKLLSNQLFSFLLVLHDLGKPTSIDLNKDKNSQHFYTVQLAESILNNTSLNKETKLLIKTLIDQDILGEYIRLKQDSIVVGEKIKQVADSVKVDPHDFFTLLKRFYLCDVGSYTSVASHALNVTHTSALDHLISVDENNKIAFSPDTSALLAKLEQQLF